MSGYAVFLLAFAASAAAPGPEIAALLARALSGGLGACLALALGIVLGKLLMLTAAILGLGALVGLLGPLFGLLKFAGAGYLIWLGWRKWRMAGRALPADGLSGGSAGLLAEAGTGLAMTLSNPVAIMFYLALLPGAIDVAAVGIGDYLTLCAIIIAVMAAVIAGYGLLAALVRRLFTTPDAKGRIDRIAAAMMLGAGVLIAAR